VKHGVDNWEAAAMRCKLLMLLMVPHFGRLLSAFDRQSCFCLLAPLQH
jgi:hypothetical protein